MLQMAKETQASGKLVNAKFLAQAWGLTVDRVYQLQRQGVIRKAEKNLYSFFEQNRQYIEYIRRDGAREDNRVATDEKKREKMDADKRYKIAKAQAQEMELDEIRAQMHRSEDIQKIWTDHIMMLRAMILAIPGKCAIDCASADTPVAAREIIKREVYEVLRQISQYEYDSAEYAARVRERKGWSIDYDEDDGRDVDTTEY